jgi:hypothetical protein
MPTMDLEELVKNPNLTRAKTTKGSYSVSSSAYEQDNIISSDIVEYFIKKVFLLRFIIGSSFNGILTVFSSIIIFGSDPVYSTISELIMCEVAPGASTQEMIYKGGNSGCCK